MARSQWRSRTSGDIPFGDAGQVNSEYTPVGLGQYTDSSLQNLERPSIHRSNRWRRPSRPSHWSVSTAEQKADNCSGKTCVGGNVIAQRNYPCDNFVIQYFGGQSDVTLMLSVNSTSKPHYSSVWSARRYSSRQTSKP